MNPQALATALVLLVCCPWSTATATQAQVRAATPAPAARETPGALRTLTTAREAHNLTLEQAARHYPVHLRGLVTDVSGQSLFLHDASGSIYVQLHPPQDTLPLPPGTLIDLEARTSGGGFAPVVDEQHIKVLGTAPLPTNADKPSLARLLSGDEDGQWVELTGVVHSVVLGNHFANLQLSLGDGVIPVAIAKEPGADYSRLVDAKIRIRGNACPLLDKSGRKMIGVRVRSPGLSMVQVLEAAPQHTFEGPAIPIDHLLEWNDHALLAHRVHVQGRVTLGWPGVAVCLRDAARDICAKTRQSTALRTGELIDVAGFVGSEGGAPSLSDAVFRPARATARATQATPVADTPVAAVPVSAEEVLAGEHQSQLTQIDGQLISRDLTSKDTVLLISSGKSIFAAVLPQGLSNSESDAWKNGSMLRITGVCAVQIDAEGTALGGGAAVSKSFRILLRSPRDVIVLHSPSWWTPRHAVAVLALALSLTLSVLAWVMALRRRLKRQTTALGQQTELLRDSEERFRHMALYDSLTGLATRVLLLDRMQVAIEAAKRHRTGLVLFMLDLDKFKQINDQHGHQAGDQVLCSVAERILNVARPSDTVARLGGDEFVVLLPELKSSADAEQIAVRMILALQAPISFDELQLSVAASIGICTTVCGDLSVEALFKHADAALYRAKQGGGGRFESFCSNVAVMQPQLELPPTLDGSLSPGVLAR